MVIANVTLNDSATFSCTLKPEIGSGLIDEDYRVQLIVKGICVYL